MICDACQIAGDMNGTGAFRAAENMHNNCDYPQSCTCQHGTGRGWVKRGHARS